MDTHTSNKATKAIEIEIMFKAAMMHATGLMIDDDAWEQVFGDGTLNWSIERYIEITTPWEPED